MIYDLLFLKPKDKTSLKIIKKIHRSFGHPSSVKLKLTLKYAGVTDKDFFKKVDEVTNCEFCRKLKRKESRP